MTNFEAENSTFQNPENQEKELTPAERRHEIVDEVFDAEADEVATKVPELMDEFVRSLALSADSGEITTGDGAITDSETGKKVPRPIDAQELLVKVRTALENRDKDPNPTDASLAIWDRTIPRIDGLRNDVKYMINDAEYGEVLSVELNAAIGRHLSPAEKAEDTEEEPDTPEAAGGLSEADRQMIEHAYERGIDLIRGDMGEALARAHNKVEENGEALVHSDRLLDDFTSELDQIQHRLSNGAQNLDAYGFSTLVGHIADEINGRRSGFARNVESAEETKRALHLAPRGLSELNGAVESLDQAHRLELTARGEDPNTIENRAAAILEQTIDAVSPNEELSADLAKLVSSGQMATGEIARAINELDELRQMTLRGGRIDLDASMQVIGRLRSQLGSVDSGLGRKVYGGLQTYGDSLKSQHQHLSGE